MGTDETAEMLWQAKLAIANCHEAMADNSLLEWLKRPLAPVFKAKFGDKKMILTRSA